MVNVRKMVLFCIALIEELREYYPNFKYAPTQYLRSKGKLTQSYSTQRSPPSEVFE